MKTPHVHGAPSMAPRTRTLAAAEATASAAVAVTAKPSSPCAQPMASPAKGKRARDEEPPTEQTCKAPRLGDGGLSSQNDIKDALAQLKASISALKAINPQRFDEEELEIVRESSTDLDKVIDGVDAQVSEP